MLSEQTLAVIDGLIRVLFYTLYVAGPIMILIILMYQYEKYKKWKDKEAREAERIIVKRNEEVVETNKAITALEAKKAELKLAVEAYEVKLSEQRAELGDEPITDDEMIKQVDNKLTIKELHALAKERGIKGFSRMKKEDLITALSH